MPRNTHTLLAIMTAATILIGAQITYAWAASYLYGWTVEIGGDEVCSDPYMNSATRTIECD
jgi:hypothetical protein